ncbi:MAG: cupredoxin domain-containing protein [Armatimonadota bacterium]
MRTGVGMVLIALVAAVAAGCAGGGGGGGSSSTGSANTVRIVGKDNVYEPATVEIKAGTEYEFVLKNDGAGAHNAVIEAKAKVGQDFSSDPTVNPGDESKWKVKIDQAGTYTIQCTLHPEMKGELKVAQ